MSIYENILLALAGLKASKMRALLTMLGIIIGIGSVIAIVTVGNTLQASVANSMAELGMNNMEIGLMYTGSSDWVTMDQSDYISDEIIANLERDMGDKLIATAVQEYMGGGQVRDGRKYANTTVIGVSPGYQIARNIEMVSGRFLADRDHQKNRNVAVISDFMAERIFGNADPLGKEVKFYTDDNTLVFTVVGVYHYAPNAMFGNGRPTSADDINTELYIPVSTSLRLSGMWSGYYWFMAVAAPDQNAYEVSAEVEAYMNKVYEKNDNWSIRVYSYESMLDQMTSQLQMVATTIAVIAAISLLVGGIGVMNIMLVSVTERTREIGTRKALGARNSAIRGQFIVESIIICIIGGIFGVLLGVGLGIAGSSLLQGFTGPALANSTVVISVPAIIFAVGFSMVIGIFFGFYPANKAAKLDPIDALRYE